jgi:hypothetical protein
MSANVPLIAVAVGAVLAVIDRLAVIVLCRKALREGVEFDGQVKTFGHSLKLTVQAAEVQLRPEDSTSGYEAIAGRGEAPESPLPDSHGRVSQPSRALKPGDQAFH